MTARGAGVALLFVLAAAPAPARAEGPAAGSSPVRIGGADCAAAPAFATFVESLRVELAGRGPKCCTVEREGAPGSPSGGVALAVEPCDPSREMVVVSLDDRARGRSVRRQISLADVAPEARPRALALAVAELLRSLEQPPAPEPERTGAPQDRPPAAGGGWTGSSAGAAVGAELRYYPSPSTVLWGARLAPSFVRDHWSATLDLHAASGNRRFDIGTVDVRLFGVGLAVGPRFALGRAALDLGLAGELGWAWIGGESIQPGIASGAGSGLIGAVGVRIGIEAPAAHLVRAQALIQAGTTVQSLTGEVNGVAEVGVSGAYVLFGLGVGLYGDR